MYGDDLFGDLPSAKSSTKKSNEESKDSSSSPSDTSQKGQHTKITTTKVVGLFQQAKTTSSGGAETNKNSHHDVFGKNQTKKAPVKHSSSLVGALGNAGTTMAFVPAAVRRKRQAPVAPMIPTASNSSSAVPSKGKIHSDLKASQQTIKRHQSNEKNIVVGQHLSSTFTTKTITGASDKTSSIIISEKNNNNNNNNNNSQKDTTTMKQNEQLLNNNQEEKLNEDDDYYVESKELQNLHSSILPSEMYDPKIPNDYLACKQRIENEIIRSDIEKQAKKTLEMQQRLRSQIEEERKKAEASGDLDKIVESRTGGGAVDGGVGGGGMGRGRGRGRGQSNLPAWLVQKQKEQQQQQKDNEDEDVIMRDETQFTDADTVEKKQLGYAVLLTNMVGPGETDDELADEVREECELQCGPVLKVDVHDASSQSPEVRVIVTFQKQEHAAKAETLFHGRMFGNRKISSKLL